MTTTTKGWAVVGPEGVALVSLWEDKKEAMDDADEHWLTERDGQLLDGYRLARVTITVDDEGGGDGVQQGE